MVGWTKTTLGQICKVDWGNTNLTKKSYVENGRFAAVSATGSDGRIDFAEHKAGTPVLSAIGAQCGKMFLPTEDFTAIKNTITLTPNTDLCSGEYLFHLLNAIELPKRGAAQPFISKGDIQSFQISIPPLAVQKAIVAKLDAAFANIDTAIVTAEKNAENAKQLFQRYLSDVFERGDEGWEQHRLKDIAEYFNGLTYSPKSVSENGTIVLRSSNIQNDEIDFADIVRVDAKIKDKIYVRNGDILMCSRNGSKRLVGKTADIRSLPEMMTFGTFMMIVRSDYNDYLSWFFKSNSFREQITSGENTMINQITRYMLDDIKLRLPPEHERDELVNRFNSLSSSVRQLDGIYVQKKLQLSSLKQSLLQQAFSGQLVNA